MRLSILLIFISFASLGQAPKFPYAEHIANLAIFIEENPSPENLLKFRDSLITPSPVPIHHPKFQGLVDAYMDWGRLPMKQDFFTMATSFGNDTLNQYGFIQYMREAFTNGIIDTLRYRVLSDSVLKVSLHESFSELIRNQNYRLRISNTMPDFDYPLVNGGTFRFSESEESYLLLEFPLPQKHDDPSLSARHYFNKYPNLKILRVALLPDVFKDEKMKNNPFIPLDPDVIIYNGDPIDQFLKMRSSPRWLLINKKMEVVSRDLRIGKYADREKIEELLKLEQ